MQNATELEEVAPVDFGTADEAAACRRLDLGADGEPVYEHGGGGGGAKVKWTRRYRGCLAVILNLLAFPFDRQELLICIRPRNGTQKVVLRAAPQWRTVQGPAAQVVGFHFVSHTLVEFTTAARGSLHGACYSEAHVRLVYDRVAATPIWNIFMPMFAVVCLSWTSFSIEPTDIASRLSVTTTMVLTAVALKYVVSEALPALSHLTWVDTFIVNGFVNLFCCSVFQALSPNVLDVTADTTDEAKLAALRRADRVCFVVCVATWGSYCAWLYWNVQQLARLRAQQDMPLYVRQLEREHEASGQQGKLVIPKRTKKVGRVQPQDGNSGGGSSSGGGNGGNTESHAVTHTTKEHVLDPLFSMEHGAKLQLLRKKLRREAKHSGTARRSEEEGKDK